MTTRFHLLVAAVSALNLACLAAEPDLSKLPPAGSQKGVTFAKDIKPLFEKSCTRCHGAERQRGELRVDTLEGVLKGGENGKVLKPGDSTHSVLIHSIAQIDPETAMPPKRGGRGGPGGGGDGKGRGPGGERGDGKGQPDGDGKGRPGGFGGREGQGGPGGRPGFGGPGGPGGDFVTRMMENDKNKDGKLTKDELSERAQGMIARGDTNKDGALDKGELEVMQKQFAQGGPGGPGGRPGGFGGTGGPGGGPQSQPLTAQEVGLVRAWIDQGAK